MAAVQRRILDPGLSDSRPWAVSATFGQRRVEHLEMSASGPIVVVDGHQVGQRTSTGRRDTSPWLL
jgi:hypothetical protein